jgi:hypothetical protein
VFFILFFLPRMRLRPTNRSTGLAGNGACHPVTPAFNNSYPMVEYSQSDFLKDTRIIHQRKTEKEFLMEMQETNAMEG